jgi:hypothetical protein
LRCVRLRVALLLLVTASSSLATASCGRRVLTEYEYEEDVYLDLDGSATVMVNASIPALVALRGLSLDPSPRARIDRDAVRAAYQSPVSRVARISRPWRRHGRRFIHVRLDVADIRNLSQARPFAWSDYRFSGDDRTFVYVQRLGPAANKELSGAGWRGDELVAFRLHLPSKIQYHTAKRLERGNILTWNQPLRDRLAGIPIRIEARMEARSILYRALWLFAGAFAGAVATLAVAVWWMVRSGRKKTA